MSDERQAAPTRAKPLLLPANEVVSAVRATLEAEVTRVADPHSIPEDRAGWHPSSEQDPDAPGHPRFNPEVWQWFDLVDVAYLDRLVVVSFRWTDPSTPELTYVGMLHADTTTVSGAAAVIRSALRNLLAPGWRDRVEKSWLDRSRVLISRPRRVLPALTALQNDQWYSPRPHIGD